MSVRDPSPLFESNLLSSSLMLLLLVVGIGPRNLHGSALSISNLFPDTRNILVQNTTQLLGGRFEMKYCQFQRNYLIYSCPLQSDDVVQIRGAGASIESVWSVDIHQCHWSESQSAATLVSQYELITAGAAISVVTHLDTAPRFPGPFPYDDDGDIDESSSTERLTYELLWALISNIKMTSCSFTKSSVESIVQDVGQSYVRGIDVSLDSTVSIPRRVKINDCSFTGGRAEARGKLVASIQGSLLVRTMDVGNQKLTALSPPSLPLAQFVHHADDWWEEGDNMVFQKVVLSNLVFDDIQTRLRAPTSSSCTGGAYGEIYAGSDSTSLVSTSLSNITVLNVYLENHDADPTTLCTTSILLDRYHCRVNDSIESVSIRLSDPINWNVYMSYEPLLSISHLLIDQPTTRGLRLYSSAESLGRVDIRDSVFTRAGTILLRIEPSGALISTGVSSLSLSRALIAHNTATTGLYPLSQNINAQFYGGCVCCCFPSMVK
jgi:hypothetical protein